jgi:hypothetical protein
MDKRLIGRCRAFCGICEWRDRTHCPGCQANQGKMFWGQCAVATCSGAKGYQHCGFCPELPCQVLQHAFNNPEHGDSGERLANLKNWAQGGDTYLKLTRKTSASNK